jgi:hypothetical protein
MLIHLVIARRGARPSCSSCSRRGTRVAQFDFTGSWAPIGTEDVQNDSLPVDYLGLALTEEGRARGCRTTSRRSR